MSWRAVSYLLLSWAVSSAAPGRTVVLLVTDPADRDAPRPFVSAMLGAGRLAERDVHGCTGLADLEALSTFVDPPAVRPEDDLLAVITAPLRTAPEPAVEIRDSTIPLADLVDAMVALAPRSLTIIIGLHRDRKALDTRALRASERLPVAVLQGPSTELLARLVDGVRYLAADEDADGLVDVGELHRHAAKTLGDTATLWTRPESAARAPVAGLGGPDTQPPLLLLTAPAVTEDAPVILPTARPLRVSGLIADDRRIALVTVNGLPCRITPMDDPLFAQLGYPGRGARFETMVPVGEAGFTEVTVTVRDMAGNTTSDSFLVLCGAAEAPITLGEPPSGGPDSIDRVEVEWDQTEDWRFGFRLHVDVQVHGRRDRPCRVQVLFRFPDGRYVRDFNGRQADAEGRAATWADFTPEFDHARVSDLRLFMPQRELHLSPGTQHRLQAQVLLLAVDPQGPRLLAEAQPLWFEVSEPYEQATIYSFELRHNERQGTVRGLAIAGRFQVAGLKDRPCQATVYFQHANGRPLTDRNGHFRAADGSVAVFRDFTPRDNSVEYTAFPLFLPYNELDLPEPGTYPLRARLVIWDRRTRRPLDAGPWVYFTVETK